MIYPYARSIDTFCRVDRHAGRVGYFGHRRGFGVEEIAPYGAFIYVHTQACRDEFAGVVLDADTGGHRVLIVLDARRQIVNRCPGRRVGNIYVERFIGAPQDVLDVESHFPLRGRSEAHAPSEVGRQRSSVSTQALLKSGIIPVAWRTCPISGEAYRRLAVPLATFIFTFER